MKKLDAIWYYIFVCKKYMNGKFKKKNKRFFDLSD